MYPKRTDTGYRKYSQTDIERLRYILTMQRDYYMPLKVIRQHLDDLEAGRAINAIPAPVSDEVLDQVLGSSDNASRKYTLRELAEYSGASTELIDDLVEYGLIEAKDG